MSLVLIGGGGSGGHLFPGIAVADALSEEDPSVKIEFVGAKRGIEARILPEKKYPVHLLPISGFYGVNLRKKIKALSELVFSTLICIKLILTKKPAAILGVGGYSSAPLLFAAAILRKPFFIQEQNVSPGMVNRFLGKRALVSFLAFEGSPEYYRNPKVVGNPIRREIEALHPRKKNFDKPELTLTVLGGSRGAHILNQTMCELFPLLEKNNPGWRIIHQTGERDYEHVCEVAQKSSLAIEVIPFIREMDALYEKTDLVFSRSGSGVCEYFAARLPSVLVPIPGSSGNHQRKNAEWIAERKAGVLIDQSKLTAIEIELILRNFAQDRSALQEMSENSGKLFSESPARKIASEILRLSYENQTG